MTVRSSGTHPIHIEQDVVLARQLTRKLAQECGMRLIDLTKMVTAVSELARNTMVYGGGGDMDWEILEESGRTGLRLVFRDEGPGIPEEEKDKIFERFYRIGNESVRKTKGTGLGLYLCKKIAHDHNAYISVTNLSPTGSNFTIHFKI